MTQIKISVILPLYKVEKYLSECLDSIISQSLREFEIIAVDDGSPDRSGEIADEYAAVDPRIKVIHQENHGVGHARNIGLAAASGTFVYIMDSDDWLEPGALGIMYEAAAANHADSVIIAHWECHENGKRIKKHSGNRPDYGELRFLGGPAWSRLIRRQVIIDHPEIRFPENIWTGQDTVFCLLLDFYTDKIIRLDDALVNYRQHPESKLHSLGKKRTAMNNAIFNTLDFWRQFTVAHPVMLEKYAGQLAFIVCIPLVFYPYSFMFGLRTVWHFRSFFRELERLRKQSAGNWLPFAWKLWHHGIFLPPVGIHKILGLNNANSD